MAILWKWGNGREREKNCLYLSECMRSENCKSPLSINHRQDDITLCGEFIVCGIDDTFVKLCKYFMSRSGGENSDGGISRFNSSARS